MWHLIQINYSKLCNCLPVFVYCETRLQFNINFSVFSIWSGIVCFLLCLNYKTVLCKVIDVNPIYLMKNHMHVCIQGQETFFAFLNISELLISLPCTCTRSCTLVCDVARSRETCRFDPILQDFTKSYKQELAIYPKTQYYLVVFFLKSICQLFT